MKKRVCLFGLFLSDILTEWDVYYLPYCVMKLSHKDHKAPLKISKILWASNTIKLCCVILSFSFFSSLHRPSSLILVHLFTHGRPSPTEYLLAAKLSSWWSTCCTLWFLRLCATAAPTGPISSSGLHQTRKVNDEECLGCQGCLNKRLKYLQITTLCLQLLAAAVFGEGAATCNLA